MLRVQLVAAVFFTLITSSVFAMKGGIGGHSQGDIIALQTDDQIAQWCDFNKTIIVTATNVLCVYNGKQ